MQEFCGTSSGNRRHSSNKYGTSRLLSRRPPWHRPPPGLAASATGKRKGRRFYAPLHLLGHARLFRTVTKNRKSLPNRYCVQAVARHMDKALFLIKIFKLQKIRRHVTIRLRTNPNHNKVTTQFPAHRIRDDSRSPDHSPCHADG